MRHSTTGILTSHAGSLPRPDDLVELNHQRQTGEGVDEAAFAKRLTGAIDDLVKAQVAAGIDVVGDGEFGKAMGTKVDYGAWRSYAFGRLSGIETEHLPVTALTPKRSEPGHLQITSNNDRRDRLAFAEAYADQSAGTWTTPGGTFLQAVVTGPITYTGKAQIDTDIANFRAALDASGVEEGFMTALGPASASRIDNRFYASDEELLFACADAMREEYAAIIDAGIVLQIDDPAIAENFDAINPAPSIEDYLAFTRVRIEALNHALEGLPEDRIRFHLCWGSWHGPHTTDIPMADIVETMLDVHAGGYSFEAANARHEHEWKIWQDVRLPEGKVIYPGIVSHATNVVEHPELVAERIIRFADAVGAPNVVAATDCGLGGRIHPQIAWAKLETLAAGARLASERLYR
jgi:5-methyltetrahydropteroyltriglutamate--homocysteine methyltransferase